MARMSAKKDPQVKGSVAEPPAHLPNPIANLNRKRLAHANVFALSLSGGPGCGKSSLIEASITRLARAVKLGVIACDVATNLDADRMLCGTDQVVQINTGQQGTPDALHIYDGLDCLDLSKIDLLVIENAGTLVGCNPLELGQESTAALFSVAGGHDKADKHPDLVRCAEVVILNKIDLLRAVPFDLNLFRSAVHRLNPHAMLFELSAVSGEGMDQWLLWLSSKVKKIHQKPSQWFG